MATTIEIVPIAPFSDGQGEGRKIGRSGLGKRTSKLLKSKYLKDNLGAMSRVALARYVMSRLETPPDYTRYPELQDVYPERLDRLRGLAKGAGCSLEEAAVADYVAFKEEIDRWWHSLQLQREPGRGPHCSGVMIVGPDGVIGGQSAESGPPPMPRGYKPKTPGPCNGRGPQTRAVAFGGPIRTLRPVYPRKLVLRKPRTGYIASWGTTNEKGLGGVSGNSNSTWLDEPIEDTWPIGQVPLLRFAANVQDLVDLWTRYTLHNWGRGSSLFGDIHGDAVAVEKSFRRVDFRRINGGQAIWTTEGYFHCPQMNAFQRQKRLEYVEKKGVGLGAGDLQYANDCQVRFTRLAELCSQPWGYGYDHIRRVLTDHAPFPRAVCRHGGPDTAPYDNSVTMGSGFSDLTHNRSFSRGWIPWKKFPCEMPEKVTQYPARPA